MSELETNTIICADSLDYLDTLPANSIHACVTDPPYGLAFMGRDWDDFEPKEYQEWCEQWAKSVKRVLKPGGHLLAFSGNRTHHRLFTGVEDAGFEIRDTLTWHYGSGFPKATDLSKTIDKRKGEFENREVVDSRKESSGLKAIDKKNKEHDFRPNEYFDDEPDTIEYSNGATPEAKKWDGWKTGLKPATEYIVMARKPFDGATVDCVLEHGTGALNIDGCRVESDDVDGDRNGEESSERRYSENGSTDFAAKPGPRGGSDKGRYPSNVIFDELEAERLDEQKNVDVHGANNSGKSDIGQYENTSYSAGVGERNPDYYGDNPEGPSRYFYTSKASKSERTENGSIENAHPTVKPQDLMEWLIKLVTKEGQVVLDPFTGSGTTLKACKQLNREFIGIEKQAQWADVARVRCGLTPNDPSVVRDTDSDQQGLETYTD